MKKNTISFIASIYVSLILFSIGTIIYGFITGQIEYSKNFES